MAEPGLGSGFYCELTGKLLDRRRFVFKQNAGHCKSITEAREYLKTEQASPRFGGRCTCSRLKLKFRVFSGESVVNAEGVIC